MSLVCEEVASELIVSSFFKVRFVEMKCMNFKSDDSALLMRSLLVRWLGSRFGYSPWFTAICFVAPHNFVSQQSRLLNTLFVLFLQCVFRIVGAFS